MARATWSGSLGFGLVNVPVKLFSAVEEKGIHFHQFQEGTNQRIRNKPVNEDTGKEEARARTGKVAIARFVMRTKQYLAAVRPGDGVLLLERMHFHDEIRDTGDLEVQGRVKVADKERKIAEQLVRSMATDSDPSRYEDTYREAVLDLIRRKGRGEELEVEHPAADDTKVVDLMAALEASVKASRDARKKKAS